MKKATTTGTRFRRALNPDYTAQGSPRLKQLYFDKYLSIKAQYSVRWTDMLTVGSSTCPGMFLHALAMPAFIKLKGISRWPLLLLTCCVLSHLLHGDAYPTAGALKKLLGTDYRTVRAAINYCMDHNFIGFVNQGYQGRGHKTRSGGYRYYLTLKGQEVLNEYYAFCHIYYDQIGGKLCSTSKNIG